MDNYSNAFINTLRYVFVSILIIASLFLLSSLLSLIKSSSVQAVSTSTPTPDSPNIITNGMALAASDFKQTLASTALSIDKSTSSFTSTLAQGGRNIIGGIQTGVLVTARTMGAGLSFTGRTIGSGVSFVFGIPGDVLGFVSNTAVVRAIIRPSDNMEVPIIDPNSPELLAAIAALPPTQPVSPAVPQGDTGPAWPIRGEITTQFGVAHMPYQRTHTGIDISDAQRSGVTPIKPFRPGRVIDAGRSKYGLGNQVVIDHGNGVTSVYGHLNSISVQVGQEVGMTTTLGFEGSTGVSTGTHLHFEIRVNDQAADPHQFINGQP